MEGGPKTSGPRGVWANPGGHRTAGAPRPPWEEVWQAGPPLSGVKAEGRGPSARPHPEAWLFPVEGAGDMQAPWRRGPSSPKLVSLILGFPAPPPPPQGQDRRQVADFFAHAEWDPMNLPFSVWTSRFAAPWGQREVAQTRFSLPPAPHRHPHSPPGNGSSGSLLFTGTFLL